MGFCGCSVDAQCAQPNGKANFPEYHHVYIEKKNVDAYLKTGEFPEGTVIVKELTRVLDPTFPDGSRTEPSGRGYFNGEYNGMDVTVKDSKRFAETNNWGFFNFGHHAWPYRRDRQGSVYRANVQDVTSPMSLKPT